MSIRFLSFKGEGKISQTWKLTRQPLIIKGFGRVVGIEIRTLTHTLAPQCDKFWTIRSMRRRKHCIQGTSKASKDAHASNIGGHRTQTGGSKSKGGKVPYRNYLNHSEIVFKEKRSFPRMSTLFRMWEDGTNPRIGNAERHITCISCFRMAIEDALIPLEVLLEQLVLSERRGVVSSDLFP